ncbi:MAG: ywqD 2 [Pedosphaera sp.]|nr:ywqD 2 [Pedosphaera sp.]
MDPLKASSQPETKLHFLDYWRIIRIRKTVILAVFLLVVVTATIVTFVLPEDYSSKARIQVDRDITDVPSVSGSSQMPGIYDPYFMQTEFEVIQSEAVLSNVVEKLDLTHAWAKKAGLPEGSALTTSECRAGLKHMLDLRPERNNSLFDITVYSQDKQEAATVANAIAEVYRQYRLDERQRILLTGIEAFKKETEVQNQEITKKEAEVNQLRKDLDVVDTDPQSAGPGSTLGPVNVMQYNSHRIDAETQWVKEEKLLSELKKLGTAELRQVLPTTVPDTQLSRLLEDYISTDTKLIAQSTDLGEEHPEVVRTKKLLAELDLQLDKRVKGIMEGLQTRVESLKAVVDNSEAKVAEARTNDIAIAERTRPYFMAKNDLDRLKRFRDVLYLRTVQEKVEEKMPRNTVVKILDRAEVSLRPVRPNKPFNIAVGVVIGLVVGLGLAFFIEYLDTSVKTIDDVERTLQSPVLGVIPQNIGHLLDEGAESPHAEAYRILRTNIMFSRKDDKLNTVAVVSAGAGEGKSTTVYNLATVFAQSGQRVLMVDSDLRRPTLHKLLQISNTLGLTNYLMKQNTLEEVIQTTRLPSLDFLASGKLPSSSLGILNSTQMRDLITELKKRYDFVFFDSPPIMGVSDASILASEVDMTLQVIQYRRYPQPMNIRAKQLIEKVGGNLVGIVLNNISLSQDESYYYYSGYYHDYYSKNEDEAASGTNGSSGEKSRIDRPS